MTNTIKFSQFPTASLSDSSTIFAGLASGANITLTKTPSWTTAGRPSPPYNGLLGYNTDLEEYEYWSTSAAAWIQLASSVSLTATFITKIPELFLPNSFALATLTTGILKSQTLTGNLSISPSLTSIDSLTTIANEILYTTAADTYAVTSLSPFSRGLLALSSAGAWATALGVPTTPVSVAQGGTGKISFTPFSVITGGTSPSGALQNVVGVGLAGQTLTSNGAGLLPTWQTSSGSGTVNPGLINEIAYYAAAGTVVSGLATAANGILITGNTGIPSISSTLPNAVQLNIVSLGTITTGVWNGSLIPLGFGGTNANLVASAGSVVYSTASEFSLSTVGTSGQLLQSNGAGAPTWTTATFPSSVGTAGTILRSNGTNWVASTSLFADTYAASNILYSSGANNVVGLATGNNGVLVTSGGGVPSISSTLPSTVQLNITSLGTVTTGVWNGSQVTVPFGGTGDVSFTPYALVAGGTSSTGNLQNVSGVGTIGQVLVSQGAGALPVWTTVSGTGTINSGLINDLAFYAANGTTLSPLATLASGTLVTDAGGVPSISQTLPLAVQANITEVGTIASGVWNGTDIDVAHGGTGDSSFTAFSVICAGTTSTGNFQNVSGLGLAGQVLTSQGAGALPQWANATGTGTVNSGLQNQLAWYAANGTTISGLATAANGLLVTSNSDVPSILAGPGSTGNILQSNSASSPSFSTATYPSIATSTGTILRANGTNWVSSTSTFSDTYTINNILFASGTNIVTGLATGNNGLLVTSSTGVPSILAGPGTTGNILQSNAAAAPSFSTATYPSTAGTSGNVLKSNGTNFVSSTFASNLSVPQVTVLTSGSGTYTTPTSPSPLYLHVRAVGGGGGGASAANAGSNGVDTTFGTALIIAGKGTGGAATSAGGAGGTGSGGTINIPGGTGCTGTQNSGVLINISAGSGGASAFGGGGSNGTAGAGPGAGSAYGSGGGGGASTTAPSGGGGGAGGYCESILTSPLSSYSYAIGGGGAGGTGGAQAGAAGAGGLIIVIAYFQ